MSLDNVIGQSRAKQMLALMTQTFSRTGTMPPIGIFGPSGYGKTHLVTAWANDIGMKVVYINGTAVRDALAFRSYFKDAVKDSQNRYVIFIDECHMLPNKVQENLLSVLEKPSILCTVANKEIGNVQCVDGNRWIDKGDVIREALPDNLSFIFATTDPAQLKETILNRLRKINLESYSLEDKIKIAKMHLTRAGFNLHDTGIYEAIAKRCRSIRQLREELCESFIDVSVIYDGTPQERLGMMDSILGIDEHGATDLDCKYMEYLLENKLASLVTLAGYLKVDKQEILDRIEPFLLEKQWIQITSKGRTLTALGRKRILKEEDNELSMR
jgi:Holliday junction DNA helicase RuvB